jgi:TPR repeat protein
MRWDFHSTFRSEQARLSPANGAGNTSPKPRWRFSRTPALALLGLAVLSQIFLSSLAEAAGPPQRHALVIGVSDYGKDSGLASLRAPVHDAEMVKAALENLRNSFNVEILTNDKVKDKQAFERALDQFLERVESEDEVVFYFSGHGYSIPEQITGKGRSGNHFLLPSAKSQEVFLRGLPTFEQRALDTGEKKERAYRDWIASVALSETEIEERIHAKAPKVLVIIADSCRSLISGATKGANVVTGVTLPRHQSTGTFRLYSASSGQISLDSPDPIESIGTDKAPIPASKPGAKKETRTNSLFTRALLGELNEPGLEISVLAAKVKVAVRSQARKQNGEQIPDFTEGDNSTEFYFAPADFQTELASRCNTAKAELAQLRYGVGLGSIGRDVLQEKYAYLSRCGAEFKEELKRLMRIEAQGVGALESVAAPSKQGAATAQQEQVDPGDPIRFCDVNGSSPLDPDRPQGVAGYDLQRIALAVNSGEIGQEAGEKSLREIADACEKAVTQRRLVARYQFNAARAFYGLATITSGIARSTNLARASHYYQSAADAGYAAAYNNLALMHQNGEYFVVEGISAAPQPVDREKAAELLIRGAELNHVVAQYNLGMAYKSGDLGLQVTHEQNRLALAFQYLGPASERGYVPAMVEAAKALHDGHGIPENPRRAIELLEIAASRGSWEAMYWLGRVYQFPKAYDESRAIIWHARAAESGDTRSQEILARTLTKGEGVPAPQREAAGRYWRLAADAGSETAQMELANLLRDGKIPFRPAVQSGPDSGAIEIRGLYLSGFARGNPEAGFELAKLYRAGFPKGARAGAIPRDADRAVALLWETINKVKQADRDTLSAYPVTEYRAGFELLSIYDSGEAKRPDGTPALTDDQVAQLRTDYGDGSKALWIRVNAIAPVRCGESALANNPWVLVWDWSREEPPTEAQFQWWERNFNCKEEERERAKKAKRKEPKPEDVGFTKQLRDIILREYKAARADAAKKAGAAKTFRDRMADLVSKTAGKKQSR